LLEEGHESSESAAALTTVEVTETADVEVPDGSEIVTSSSVNVLPEPTQSGSVDEAAILRHEVDEHVPAAPSEATQDNQPTVPHAIHLESGGLKTNFLAWGLAIVAFLMVVFFAFYWGTAVSPHGPASAVLWNNSSLTIFTIGVLGLITVFFIDAFITTACEKLRWRLTTRVDGARVLEFIALSPSTSWTTLFWLLCARRPHTSSNRKRSFLISFRRLSALRYARQDAHFRLLVLMSKIALGVILLINMDIETIYAKKYDNFREPGGVGTINYTHYFAENDIFNQLMSSTILGNSHSGGAGALRSIFLKPSVMMCNSTACVYEADLMRALRGWSQTRVGSFNATDDDFITFYGTPFYHIEAVGGPIHYSEPCHIYGCGNYRAIVVCSQKNESDPTWLSTRTSLKFY
jgi:hypothetical protein